MKYHGGTVSESWPLAAMQTRMAFGAKYEYITISETIQLPKPFGVKD